VTDPRVKIVTITAVAIGLLAALAVTSLINARRALRAEPVTAPDTPVTAPGTRRRSPPAQARRVARPAAVRITPPVVRALTLGLRTAPVTIVEFGDYQCARCGEFAFGTQTELIRRYVHAGLVRLAWRDAPRLGVQSFRAAMAARAAGQQGQFWAFHDQLFVGHQHRAPLTDAYLRTLAEQLGLDMPAFNRDYTSQELAAVVRADENFGRQLGMRGTPAFLINARPMDGPPMFARFEAEIAKALEDA